MQKKYTPSNTLIEDMEEARQIFAEAGFLIFEPGSEYVRSKYDFVAIEKIDGRNLVMVRVGEYITKTEGTKHRIEVRRYSRHDSIGPFVIKIRSKITNTIRQRQVLPLADDENFYVRFIAEHQHEEVRYLFPKGSYRW